MPGPNTTKLFISYAHADGAALAQDLQRDLAAGGLEPWLDTQRLYGGAIWTKEIEDALDNAEVVLALLTRGSYASEICRAEQLRSLRKGKCVIPLLAQTGADIPLHLEPKQYLNFTAATGYPQQFETLLESIGKRDGASLKPAYRYTYVTAPPLPVNFVERPAELAALRNALIADGGGRHVALTALQGMGGIGKTILAQALCADEVVQQAFPDGIIWTTIGKEKSADPVTKMREIGKGLNDDLSRYDTTQGSINQYRTALRSKAALIVLDDVWDAQDVEPFRADSPRSRLLFTTRDTSIASALGAREFTANLLTDEQSRAFLAQWSGRSTSALPPEADDLIRECGRLPLALSMIGAMLRGEGPVYWKDTLDLMRRSELASIQAQFPHYPHPSLFRAIQISVDQLDANSRERYLALAVLLEDMTAELPVLQTLWNAGWDLTFNAPKTVSLTALVGQDERVRLAHQSAVRAALGETEKYVQARMGGVNPAENSGRWIAATFQHDTARPVGGYPAPHLHTHVVVFNMTEDHTGQARSLQPYELFRIQSMATAVYQNHLEAELRQLGYQIERGVNHAPDIKGYSPEYLASESLRAAQIKQAMEEHGGVGREFESLLKHQNRDQKLKLSPDELRELHRQHAAEFGSQPVRVAAEAAERHIRSVSPEKTEEKARAAVRFARSRLSERNAVFEHFEVIRDALRHTQGRAGPGDIYRELAKQKEEGQFVEVRHVRPNAPMHRYTTRELIAIERETIQMVLAGQNQRHRTAPVTEALIASRYGSLNDDQRRLVHEAITTRDQIFGIQGGAGTGKTTALTAVRELAEERGYKARGLGPTSRAAKGLAEAGIDSETLQAHLTRGYEPADEARPRLFFVDESSLASGRQMRDLLATIGPRDRVLLVGDTRQHQSVEAGRIFAELQDAGMKVGSLSQIVRQKDEGLRNVVEAMAAGEIPKGVELLGAQGRIRSIEHRQERFAAIAKEYAARPEGTLVISPDNRSREELNTAIRAELRASGHLKADAYTVPVLINKQALTAEDRGCACSYRIGDSVRYLRGSAVLGLEAKTYAVVLRSDTETNRITVQKADGRTVTYDPGRVKGVTVYEPEIRSFAEGDRVQFTTPWRDKAISTRDMGTVSYLDEKGNIRVRLDGSDRTVGWNLSANRHLDHAYAMTSHSSQGATVDRVLIHVDTSDSRNRTLVNETLAYVAISRPRHDAQVFTDNEANLAKALSRQNENTTALTPAQIAAYGMGA